jgi:hypothetical protein
VLFNPVLVGTINDFVSKHRGMVAEDECPTPPRQEPRRA